MTYKDKGSYESSPPCTIAGHEWVMSRIRMSHVTHTNASCCTYEWVVWWLRRRIYSGQVRNYYPCVCTCRVYARHDSIISATWQSYAWHTRSYAWHDSFICATWLIHRRDMTHSCPVHKGVSIAIRFATTIAVFARVRVVCMRNMTRWYAWHDPLICATRPTHMRDILNHMCDMTQSHAWHGYAWHDSVICATLPPHMRDILNHMRDMTHSYACILNHMRDMTQSSHAWHDSFLYVAWLIHVQCTNVYLERSSPQLLSLCLHLLFVCITRLIHMCDMT